MPPDPRAIVTAYLDAASRHDVDAALRHLDDDFELTFSGGPSMGKEAMTAALGWDAGVGGRLDWVVVEEDGPELVVEGTETNAFFRLLGAEPLAFRSRFRVGGDGRITHQHHEVRGPGAGYEEALAEAVAWAGEHEPDELAEIYPDGRLVYSEEMGRRWVALLRRWRKA